MKTTYVLLIIILVSLTGCNHDGDGPNPFDYGNFAFSLTLVSDPDSRIAQSLPSGAHLQISIETPEGVDVLTHHQMEILAFNDALVSVALELAEGDYLLTEFLVLSQENEILYATPLESSPLADLVNHPIPVPFTIVGNESIQIEVQVLNVALLTPADIGYVSFPFTIVSHFFLSVFQQSQDGLNLTDAMGYILQNADTLKTFAITPEINTVSFVGDPSGLFRLVVVKSGFGKHSEYLTIEGIISSYEEGIVPVTLLPALTFVAVPYEYYEGSPPFLFEFDLTFSGSLTIDWGDGTMEGICPTYESFVHEYDREGSYFVSVTGDVQNISEFKSYYGQGPMSEIDLRYLTALVDFRSGYNGTGVSPKVIDLSHSPLLTYVDVSLSQDLEELILPEINSITGLILQATNNLTPEDLDSIIASIYASVVADGREFGYIDLKSPIDASVTGPPSAETTGKLRSLQFDYQWNITPTQVH